MRALSMFQISFSFISNIETADLLVSQFFFGQKKNPIDKKIIIKSKYRLLFMETTGLIN